jgi:hypothetical protein
MLSVLIDGWQVALLTLTSAYMEGKDVINVENLINGHRHYKASAALCTNISSAVSYIIIRLILIVRPEEV